MRHCERTTTARAFTVTALAIASLVALAAPGAGDEAPRKMTPKETALWARLDARIGEIERGVDGVFAVSIRDDATGAVIERRPDEPFATASTIKLAIAYELYRQAEEKRVDLGETVHPPASPAGSAGVLQYFSPQAALSWRDVATLMLTLSDNAATNVIIDRVGLDAVNARIASLGFATTRLRRRMMDVEAARQGRENVSTARELRRLAELIAAPPGLSAEAARDLRALATLPKMPESPFRSALPEAAVVLDKPGELEGLRCAAGHVQLPGRAYSVGIMIGGLHDDADGDRAIREVSAAVYSTLDRLARTGPLGRVVSDR